MTRGSGRWEFGIWFWIAAATSAVAGCKGESNAGGPETPCSEDSDCPADKECVVTASIQQPIPFNPCINIRPCTDDSSCTDGMVCGPYVPPTGSFQCPPKSCVPRCSATSCPSGSVCAENGQCRLVKCDEPDGPTCAAHYRCDPATAASRPAMTFAGSSVVDATTPEQQVQIGCVRKLCDEPDGFVCRSTWRCDPASATNEASGCVPLPCSETGSCWDDGYSICEPENDGPRPPNVDVHGCVARNCGEGFVCQQIRDSVNYAYCALDAPGADSRGCVVRNCDELPELCLAGRICDRAAPVKDVYGCRLIDCHDPGGPACASGTTCQLASEQTGFHSCVADGAMGGGGSGGVAVKPTVGGTAGNSSGGGGGSPPAGGRSNTGGSTGGVSGGATGGTSTAADPAMGTDTGVCVDRG